MVGRFLLCALPFALACDALPGTDYDYAAGTHVFGADMPVETARSLAGVWESAGSPHKIAFLPYRNANRYGVELWRIVPEADQKQLEPASGPLDVMYLVQQYRELSLEGDKLLLTEGSPTAVPAQPLTPTEWTRVATPTDRERDVRELADRLQVLVEGTDIAWRAIDKTVTLEGMGNYLPAPSLPRINGQLAVIQNFFDADNLKIMNISSVEVGTRRDNTSPMAFVQGQTLGLCFGHETCTDLHLTAELATLLAQRGPSAPVIPTPDAPVPRGAGATNDDGGCSSAGGPGGIALLLGLWSVALLARYNRRKNRRTFRATTV